MTRDIPEEVGSQADHDEDIHEVSSAASGHSRVEDSNITNAGVTGVVTRSKRRFLANTAHGKFRGKSKRSSHVISHSHKRVTGEMGEQFLFLHTTAMLGSL